MSEGSINVKNERLVEILDEAWAFHALPAKKAQNHIAKKTLNDERLCEMIISSYALDVFMHAHGYGVTLDYSYETLSNLGNGLQGVYHGYRRMGRDVKRSGDLTVRSFAAYLFLLAINEHDCHLHSQQIVNALHPQSPEDGPLWMDERRILTGLRRETDFLLPATESLVLMGLGAQQTAFFHVKPIVRAWKSAIGEDLSAHGLEDMAMGIIPGDKNR